MTEWRPIINWPRHNVSDDGQIKITVPGLRSSQGPHVVRPWLAAVGYLMVNLYDDGRREKRYVHRLVCEAFHGPAPTPEYEVGHRDGTRTNNSASNLRWVTRQENCNDAEIHGTRLRGEHQNGAKLTDDDVRLIRQVTADGIARKKTAEHFGVSVGCIDHIVARHTWKHIE